MASQQFEIKSIQDRSIKSVVDELSSLKVSVKREGNNKTINSL